MKTIRTMEAASLCLFLGIALTAHAQEHAEKQEHGEKQEQAQPQKAQPHAQAHEHAQAAPHQHAQAAQPRQHAQAEPARQHAQNAPPRQHAQAQRPQQRAQTAPSRQHDQAARGGRPAQRTPQQQRIQQTAWRQHGSQHWESDHRDWQQRGGYHGYRIPEGRFHSYFGPDHAFRIYGLPFLVVGGYPRFRYNGCWISAVDPWPGTWASNWYDTDDVYVNYVDNGYYMYNRRYPGVGIAVNLSL